MSDTTPDPSQSPRSLSRRSRERRLGLVIILAAVLVFGGGVAVITIVNRPEDVTNVPYPDMLDSEELPEADPVWTLETAEGEKLFIHNGMLIRNDWENEVTLSVYDLATGDKTMSQTIGTAPYWLSGDFVITVDSDAEQLEVRDIRSGEELHTTPFAGIGFTTVASGALVSIQEADDGAVTLQALDVATGEEMWAKDLPGERSEYDINAPSFRWNNDPRSSYTQPEETPSPIVFLATGDDVEDSPRLWDDITAVDVATGERRWAAPIDYDKFDDPADRGFQLTDGGDIHTKVVDHGDDSSASVSYIISSSTGKAAQYFASGPLRGDTLLTIDDEHPAFLDISTGNVVWRSPNPYDRLVNAGDVVFAPTNTSGPNDRAIGTVAVDAESGEYLWARKGTVRGDVVVAGDEVVAAGWAESGDDTLQVFDRDTGSGEWQLSGAELVGHTSDFFVFTTKTGGDTAEISIVSRD